MKNLLLAIKDVLEWHDENLSDSVNRENAIRRLRVEFESAQQSVQRTVDQPCEKHNMEFCSECFPVVLVDFNRR